MTKLLPELSVELLASGNRAQVPFKNILKMGISILLLSCGELSYSKTVANEVPQVTAASLQELNSLLQKYNIKTSQTSAAQMEKLFRARTAAHRARLSEVFLELSKDPKLLHNFPEFSLLVQDSAATVRGLLAHDVGKSMKAVAPAVKVLSEMQGYDFRHAPVGVPADVHEKISQILKNAIGDINGADKKAMEKQYASLKKSGHWVHLHEDLTEVLDFYDTYKSRQAEIAQDGRKLISPSAWIQKLETDGVYSADEKLRNKNKIRLSEYLETIDPLKEPTKFSATEDFMKSNKSNYAKSIDKTFQKQAKSLIAAAQPARLPALHISRLAGLATGGALTGAITGVEYLINPESVSADSVINGFVMSSETSACDSVKCAKFVENCALQLGMKSGASPKEVLANSQFSLCLQNFFNLSLIEQSQWREDGNLDRLLGNYSPRVTALRCAGEGKKIEIETRTSQRKDVQQWQFNSAGQLASISRETKAGEDRIVNSTTAFLQHCTVNKGCQNFPMTEIEKTKTYFWRDKEIPLDSFKWAKSQRHVQLGQAAGIFQCCQSSECQKYFTQGIRLFYPTSQSARASK